MVQFYFRPNDTCRRHLVKMCQRRNYARDSDPDSYSNYSDSSSDTDTFSDSDSSSDSDTSSDSDSDSSIACIGSVTEKEKGVTEETQKEKKKHRAVQRRLKMLFEKTKRQYNQHWHINK